MAGEGADGREHPAKGPDDFPYLRRRGPLAIIGVSTAAPMPPQCAGRPHRQAEQMERLAALLARTRQDGCCRVVLIHHPPLPGPAYRPQAAYRQRRISHCHRRPGGGADPARAYPCLRPCPASLPRRRRAGGRRSLRFRAPGHGHKDHARYHLYRIDRGDRDWRILVDVRGVGDDARRFAKGARLLPCMSPA